MKSIKSIIDVESYEEAWLGLTSEDVKDIKNPLSDLSTDTGENFHLRILSLMRNPDYFHWTVKKLLNVDLLPVQTVILRELWEKSFPMYIASRGFGKSFLLSVYCLLLFLQVLILSLLNSLSDNNNKEQGINFLDR